jgi:hypothetical protein
MRRLGPPSFLAHAAVITLTLAAVAACGAGIPAGSPASPPSSAPSSAPVATSAAPTSEPGSAGAAANRCDAGAWHAAPVTVTRQVAVPPVPRVTAIRTAAHPECGYDRVVLDITGPVPGYSIRYASQVTADPSGRTITVSGRSYLLITLRPAQAHTDSGSATITPRARVLNYPMLKGYALAGDFEGVLTLALGLQAPTSIRVGELPGRLYIDLRA